eukprot:SAG11_NODE_1629_length_4547_cov_2.310701_5_plen_59_part_00
MQCFRRSVDSGLRNKLGARIVERNLHAHHQSQKVHWNALLRSAPVNPVAMALTKPSGP